MRPGSFAPPRFAHEPNPQLFSNLTHLHLIQALPTSQLLSLLVGSSSHDGRSGAALTHLRLSRLHLDSLTGLESTFTQLESLASSAHALTAPSKKTPQSLLSTLAALTARFRPRTNGSPARTELHKALWILSRTRRDCFPRLRVILLELAEQQPLEAPWGSSVAQWQFAHHLYATTTTTLLTGEAGAGVSRAPGEQTTLSGQLATLDFPADMPLGLPPSIGSTAAAGSEWSDEATAEQEEERRRTASRDAYWLAVRDGKEALVEFTRRDLLSSFSDDEQKSNNNSSSQFAAGVQNGVIEVRVVAPRPGGWSYHESQADFEASLSPSDGGFAAGAAETQSALADPDVFALAEQENGWMLGYAPTSQPALGHGAQGNGRKEPQGETAKNTMYWTGVLPRVRAQLGIIGE